MLLWRQYPLPIWRGPTRETFYDQCQKRDPWTSCGGKHRHWPNLHIYIYTYVIWFPFSLDVGGLPWNWTVFLFINVAFMDWHTCCQEANWLNLDLYRGFLLMKPLKRVEKADFLWPPVCQAFFIRFIWTTTVFCITLSSVILIMFK